MTASARTPRKVIPFRPKQDLIFGDRPREELEFLPAALEIVETPPPPLPRIMGLSLVALLASALAWASFGKVDVMSTAPGRLISIDGGKVVQPLETGKVTGILVRDGQRVHAGQVLVTLEPTETMSDRDRLKAQLAAALLEVSRLKAVALGRPFTAPMGADAAKAVIASREAQAETAQTVAKLAGLDRQVEEHQAELEAARSEAARLAVMLPLAQQRTDVYQSLQKKGYGSRLQLVEAQEKQQDTLKSLVAAEHREPELEAAIAATSRERAGAEAEARKSALAALTEAELKAAVLTDDLRKAQERLQARVLTASVDGTVQELTIHTIGGVVEPGQTLMRVVPGDASLMVEAKLKNEDVGFVREGMNAQIKVETFPFTRYGLIPARVLTVSSDAVALTPGDPVNGRKGEPPADAEYLVHLGLSRGAMMIDGRLIPLTAGMGVTAEIKTGRRRVISYIFSPLAKAAAEAGHER